MTRSEQRKTAAALFDPNMKHFPPLQTSERGGGGWFFLRVECGERIAAGECEKINVISVAHLSHHDICPTGLAYGQNGRQNRTDHRVAAPTRHHHLHQVIALITFIMGLK